MNRRAMVIEYDDGRLEHSPDVEITTNDDCSFSVTPLAPFKPIPHHMPTGPSTQEGP
jgi:hypothetical protein